MSIDVNDERAVANAPEPASEAKPRLARWALLRAALGQLSWATTLLTALLMAVVWCALFISRPELQLLAGLVPVTAGLILGRRVKNNHLLHGISLGVSGFLMGLGIIAAYAGLASVGLLPLTAQAQSLIEQWPGSNGSYAILVTAFISFSIFALLPFPAFGTVMSGRSEERNRTLREIRAKRGGSLERPSVTIRSADDLNGLSLPQFGYYVNTLFKKNGFTFQDYQFTDKDRHLDLWLEHQGETWWLRLTVADKVRPGTIESLVQEMRKREISKGMVITSTEFTPDALRLSKNRRNVLLVDGPTLFSMAH